MKKSNIKPFIAGLLIGTLVCSSIAVAFAANYSTTFKAVYRDIKVYIDDKKIDYYASNGAYCEPFIINGTTYVPLRLFSEKLDKPVLWENATSSIYIGIHESQEMTEEDAIRKAIAYEREQISVEDTYNRIIANTGKVIDQNSTAYLVMIDENYSYDASFIHREVFWVKKATGEVRWCASYPDGVNYRKGDIDLNTGEITLPEDYD